MKSGFHDDRLINVCTLVDKVFWKSEDKDQAKRLVEAIRISLHRSSMLITLLMNSSKLTRRAMYWS